MAYIDKINPAMPEGRIIIRDGIIFLKDPDGPQSAIPLEEKWYQLIKYVRRLSYSPREIQRLEEAYELIARYPSRHIDTYNTLRKRYKGFAPQILAWMMYDYYDLMPVNKKYYPSDYDLLSSNYRELIDDGMRAGQEKNLRSSTITIEAACAAAFLLYLQNSGIKSIYEMHEKQIRNYILYNKCEQIIVYRIGLFISRLSQWKQDEKLNSIAQLFPKQRAQKKVYPAMTKGEREQLETFLLEPQGKLSLRERAIGITLLYTGMRKEDLLNLRMEDFDWINNVIHFNQDKNGNVNTIPLRPVVGNAISEYIRGERPTCDCKYLFIGSKKVKGQYQGIDIPATVNKIYQLAGIRQGNVRKGTHLLRHSLADELINSGNDLSIVSKILGHNDPETTLGYLSANYEQLRQCALDVSEYPITHKLYQQQ